MQRTFSNVIHLLATFSLYFFLVFIPLSILLLLIASFIAQQVYECPYQDCFDGWIVLVVGLGLSMALTGVTAWVYGSPFGKVESSECGNALLSH